MVAPFDLVSWNSLELDHALKLTNRLAVETVITEGLSPFEYSHKTPACNKYIANIFAASFARFATTRNFSFGIPTEYIVSSLGTYMYM